MPDGTLREHATSCCDHPHLVRLALYYLKCLQVSLEKLSQIASTEVSPFRNHLRQHL
ncbi:MAG: AAA-like domain-containing protein [Brasilonema angustatum HA4187-MV1]|nr:AAA-like domain-containing protein [Brasilonema angustatum HA4187-MV1]